MPDKSKWAVKPDSTLIIYLGWPSMSVKMKVICWMENRFPISALRVTGQQNLLIARNKSVRKVLQEDPKYTDIIFMDSDLEPYGASEPFLCVDADVVGCRHDLPRADAWAKPDTIHCSLFRCKRKVLETLRPPWFMTEYSSDGCRLVKCECMYFKDKALAAGFSVAAAGWANHEISGTAFGAPSCDLVGV